MTPFDRRLSTCACAAALWLLCATVQAGSGVPSPAPAIAKATLADGPATTPEASTEELRAILAEGRTPVLDVRSAREYAIAHIPGSVNLWEKEVEQIVQRYPDPATPLVLYCNGPYCGKSRRLSEQLVKRGYTAVRRYQLGLPVWRALGYTVQTDLEGLRYVLAGDCTAVYVDARAAASGTPRMPGAVSVRRGEAEVANEDGRLPHRDKGTRVIVFGADAAEARAVAEEIARKAYWNSSYFGGTAAEATKAALDRPPCVAATP
jgi:rhodanese-related sulfurtransferase